MVKRMYGGRRTRRRTMRGGRKTNRKMYGGRRMRGGRRTRRTRRTKRPRTRRSLMMYGGGGGAKVINDSDGPITFRAGFVDKGTRNFEASEGRFKDHEEKVGVGNVAGVDQGLAPAPQGKDRALKITLPDRNEYVINRGGDGGRHAVHVNGTQGSYTIKVAEIEGNVDLPENDKNKIVQYCHDWKQVYPPQPETQSE